MMHAEAEEAHRGRKRPQPDSPDVSHKRYCSIVSTRTDSHDSALPSIVSTPSSPESFAERFARFRAENRAFFSLLEDEDPDLRLRTASCYSFGNYVGPYSSSPKNDPRFPLLSRRLFEGKRCLDIGCGLGALTIALGKYRSPKLVVGTDIDPKLLDRAIKFLHKRAGSLAATEEEKREGFPRNVVFRHENYIADLGITESFDTILCLDAVLWVQLNYGDLGAYAMFLKIFANLSAGGVLLFEEEDLKTYKKNKRLSPAMKANFRKMQFLPTQHLTFLTQTLGLTMKEKIEAPGIRRPILVLQKAYLSVADCGH